MIQHAQVTPHFSTTVYPELLNNDEAWSNILSVLWGKALYKTNFNILKCTFFLYQTENIWSLHCPNVQRLISEYPVISALKCLNFKTSQTPLSVFGKVQQGTVSPITEKKKETMPTEFSHLASIRVRRNFTLYIFWMGHFQEKKENTILRTVQIL